jgi:hypothetical protein
VALSDALRRLADDVNSTKPASRLTLRLGTVTAVDAGAAADGHDAITVTVGADEITAPYLEHPASWTPAADDLVAVLLIDGAPLILGHVIGIPDLS